MKKQRYWGEMVAFESLGKFLKSMLRIIHSTVEQICKLSHMSKRTYYKIVKGKETHLNYYIRLLEAYFEELEPDMKYDFLQQCYDCCLADIEAHN